MLVTVITITYNSAKTIKDTLQSVASQTYSNIEHIIIDAQSTDETLKIVNQFPHIKKIISEPDNGIYNAMNKGIKLATGDIISILNSDDVFENNSVLENVVTSFKNSDALIVYGNLYYVNRTDITKVVRLWRTSAYKQNAFQYGWHPPHPALFVKRNVYEKYGLFDESLAISADFELMLRFIERFKIKTFYLDKFLVRMRVGGMSNITLKNIIKGNSNIKKAFNKNKIPYKFYYPALRLLPKLLQFIKR